MYGNQKRQKQTIDEYVERADRILANRIVTDERSNKIVTDGKSNKKQ